MINLECRQNKICTQILKSKLKVLAVVKKKRFVVNVWSQHF
jgi:hypothetical protein